MLGCEKTIQRLTSDWKSVTITPFKAMKRKSTRIETCQENLRLVEGGEEVRGIHRRAVTRTVRYWERSRRDRVRPLPRDRAELARCEAVPVREWRIRGGTALKHNALCPADRGRLSSVCICE